MTPNVSLPQNKPKQLLVNFHQLAATLVPLDDASIFWEFQNSWWNPLDEGEEESSMEECGLAEER